MSDLLRELNRRFTLRDVGEVIAEYLLSQIPEARVGALFVLDEEMGRFEPKAIVGSVRISESLPATVTRELFGKAPAFHRNLPPKLGDTLTPLKSVLSLPVMEGDKVIAYLLLGGFEEFDRPAGVEPIRLGSTWEELATAVRRAYRCDPWEGLRRTVATLPNAVVIVDEKGTIRGWSRGAVELLGYLPREILGKPLSVLLPEESKARHEAGFAKYVTQGGTPPCVVGKVLRKDGKTIPVRWVFTRQEVDGETIFVAVGRDFSTREELERRVRETEAGFRVLFQRLPDAICITSLEGTILEANPQAAAQTGYGIDELIGMNIWDIATGEATISRDQISARLQEERTVFFEERKRRKDGTVYWTECAVTRIEHEGQPAILFVNRDITARKRLEEKLHQHIRELEALNNALRSVVSSLEIEGVLRRLADLSGELVEAEYAVIAVFDEKGHLRKVIDRSMGLGPFPTRMRPKGVSRLILTTGQPVVVGEISPDGSTVPPIRAPDGSVIPVNPVVAKAGVKSLAGVPIKYKGRVIGILSVFSRRPHAFDRRLSALADAAAVAVENARLYKEARYFFEESPVSLWVEDLSGIKRRLDSLREQGVTDLKAYIRSHPEFVTECLGLLQVVEVNRTTLHLYKARDFQELLTKLPVLIPQEVSPLLERELQAIWEGKLEFEGVGINRTAAGESIHIYLRWRVFPGHEDDYSRVLVSILNITERVRAEEELRSYVEKLAALHRTVWELQRCRTVEEVCRTAVEGARGILGFSVCNIGLVKGDLVEPVYSVGDVQPQPFRRGEGLVWRSLEEGRSFWGNVEDLPGAKPVDSRLKSAISVPIGNIGIFQAASFEPDAFSEDDVKLAEILAGHVSEEIRRVRLEEELRERAIRDPLTGLYNRGHLTEVLGEEIRRAGEEGKSLVVLVTDLDNFKLVNDRFGHPFGDEVLQEVARLLRDAVRDEGLVFRYGGDEFVVLLPKIDDGAEEMARLIKDAVTQWAEEKGLAPLGFGISLGMAIWTPADPLPPEELLRRADRDLYRLKRRG